MSQFDEEVCDHCQGEGELEDWQGVYECPQCEGSGVMDEDQ